MKLYDRVLVDEPQDGDSWKSGFKGMVLKIDKMFAIVQNIENNHIYCVELNKINKRKY